MTNYAQFIAAGASPRGWGWKTVMALQITPWERRALQLLAGGHTRTELARALGMGMVEIEGLLTGVFTALGAATQAEAIAAAQKRGLVSN